MRLLLDSHILLWWDSDLDKLSAAQREAISDPGNEIFVSAVSAWELGIKQGKGKLLLTKSVAAQLNQYGFRELPITLSHADYAARLPLLHRDPFDRMLIAQAAVEGLTLVTVDAAIRVYGLACL